MTRSIWIAAVSAGVLAVAPMHGQQRVPGVEVLKVNVQPPKEHVAETQLLVAYSGSIPEGTVMRVFRGSKAAQTVDQPRTARAGECVLYTTTVTYPVTADGQNLHVDGLFGYFSLEWNVGHESEQVFTLVFEHGGKNVSNGQLRLAKADVAKYFEHAIEWKLYPNSAMKTDWENQQQSAAPKQGLLAWVESKLPAGGGTQKVYAAESRPTSTVTVEVRPPSPASMRECHAVASYRVSASLSAPGAFEVASQDAVPGEALPFAVRSETGCGL